MEAVRSGFHNELLSLRRLVEYFEIENKLAGSVSASSSETGINLLSTLSNKLREFTAAKRVFNYNSIIISLYGFFEKFIEDSLVTYVDRLDAFDINFRDLPEQIQKSHYRLSLSLLDKIEQPRYSGSLTKENVVLNLNACINSANNYSMNREAYAQHSANFRHQVIDECFSRLDLLKISDRVLENFEFSQYLKEKLELNEDDVVPIESAYAKLNELAERRNDVAHGVPSQILSNQILLEYIEYFEYYSSALIETIASSLHKYEIQASGLRLGEITDVFDNGYVVCLYSNNVSMMVGDYIIGRTSQRYVKAKILEIQIEGNSTAAILSNLNIEIGIKLDNKFKDNFEIFAVRSN